MKKVLEVTKFIRYNNFLHDITNLYISLLTEVSIHYNYISFRVYKSTNHQNPSSLPLNIGNKNINYFLSVKGVRNTSKFLFKMYNIIIDISIDTM